MKSIIFIFLFMSFAHFSFSQKDSAKPRLFDRPVKINPNDTLQPSDTLILNYCDCHGLKDYFRNYTRWNLYTKDKKQLSKCGYFLHGKLIFGFKYIYSDDGKLIAIEKIYKGNKIGNCPVETK